MVFCIGSVVEDVREARDLGRLLSDNSAIVWQSIEKPILGFVSMRVNTTMITPGARQGHSNISGRSLCSICAVMVLSIEAVVDDMTRSWCSSGADFSEVQSLFREASNSICFLLA